MVTVPRVMAKTKSDLDFLGEGHEPDEEVGPQGADVDAAHTELKAGENEHPPEEAQYNVIDELAEPFGAGDDSPVIRSPVDGLPMHADSPTTAIAPPFTFGTVVCVEDDREYVELFAEELERRVDSSFLGKFLTRMQYDDEGIELERAKFKPKKVITKWGVQCVETKDGLVPVRPLRERCKHYKRQVFANDSESDPNAFGHKIVFRNCLIRRSVGGAFLSLRDEAVYACDYRDPPDLESSKKHLDQTDSKRLRSNAHEVHLPLFNIS